LRRQGKEERGSSEGKGKDSGSSEGKGKGKKEDSEARRKEGLDGT
jgi:hypothetical protein